MYRSLWNVRAQQLTPGGSRVEKALAEYKEQVNPPFFTTGHVACCPSLMISAEEPGLEDNMLEHPYTGIEELYCLAEQSQVGTAEETLFRLDARKSKEFSKVKVLNESWKDEVTAVCHQICQALAPGANRVNAELYKLLLYCKGDFFCLHQDAQHSARMFATLLFFLPVQYTGGEFKVYNPESWNASVVVEDKKMADGCSWVAFYTDVRHEVNQVEEGFRVVLNYCLSFDGTMSPSAFMPQTSASAIADYLKTFDKKMLAIPLTYQYTLATLFPDFLKGIDAYIFRAIEALAVPELHFVIRFDKTKVIPYDDYGIESDHKQVFQGVFLVDRDIAQRYFEIKKESEQKMAGKKYQETESFMNERDDKYFALVKDVKASQSGFSLEWIAKREYGNPIHNWNDRQLNFEHGQLGWLGNMTPAEEYYYLQVAIIVRGGKN